MNEFLLLPEGMFVKTLLYSYPIFDESDNQLIFEIFNSFKMPVAEFENERNFSFTWKMLMVSETKIYANGIRDKNR